LRNLIFNIAINSTGRMLAVRDRLLSRIGRDLRLDAREVGVSRHEIPSGKCVLDAVLVRPAAGAERASLLICHGIGETVQHWVPVQRLLAVRGVASLVFDYAGYGRSTCLFSVRQAEADAMTAFEWLRAATAPLPVSLMGFSLGSGVASAVVGRLSAQRLVLGAAFTSMRKAAVSVGFPRVLAGVVPAIWDAKMALRDCRVPVLVVHGEKDQLFPVRMAEELARYCGPHGELGQLIVVPGLRHDEPFYLPTMEYWGLIADWVVEGGREAGFPPAPA